MKAEILRLLRETDGYVSGQELCNQFGVSRTAVWKAINQLKEAGYEIEAVQNKGYHLVSVPDRMDEVELASIRRPNGQARKRIILIRLIPRTRKQKNWQKKDIRPELLW